MGPFRVSRLRPKEKRKKDATRQFKINRALGSKRTPQDVDPFLKDVMKNFLKSKSIILKLLELSMELPWQDNKWNSCRIVNETE